MLLQACWAVLSLLLLCQSFWLEAARGLEEAVKCESINEATIGQEANFSCDFLLRMNVFQVTWQKINGSSFWNIATYSQIHGLRLQESFQRKACFTVAALNTSAIALRNLTSEDASCYRCIFNVFPYGSFSSPDLCLKIQNSGNTNNKIEDKMLGMGSTNTRESVNTSNPEVKKLYVGSTNTRESGNTNNKIEDKMQVIGSPSTRGISGIQKRIDLVVFFLGAVLGTLILLIVGLIKTRRRKLQKRRAHRTPEKEEGLQEDVSEQSVSLETPKVQGSAYQNEEDLLHRHQPVVAEPSFLRFLNMGVMFLFFQSPRTSPDSCNLSNMMESSLATTSVISLRSLGCMSCGIKNMYTFSLMRWSWTCSAGVQFCRAVYGAVTLFGYETRMFPHCQISTAPVSCRVDGNIHASAML
ncbi:uncharacterized protein LOC107321458 isoform X1 [Coturnix japonica]|uniref:uncharacterized protein LOC107321458 isoform X1 n=1 Tax=Coturnix japonica TaxID=93934 RepID=UPI0013A5D930|nr:uncharacterized protein LOC107321458 isoform X1 [Coturnix japonica]